MNPVSLAFIAGLSAVMLVLFLITGQPLNLTITAVPVTAAIATLAVFFYGREEAREDAEQDDDPDEPLESPPATPSDETLASVQPDETQTIDSD